MNLKKIGEQAYNKMEKINSELLTLTYGSFIVELIKDNENIEEVNKELLKIGKKIGERIIDEYYSKSGIKFKSKNFKECGEYLSKVAFKMFLGVECKMEKFKENKSEGTASFILTFDQNPLLDFVSLPKKYSKEGNPDGEGLIYCNVFVGLIDSALQTINYKVNSKIINSPLLTNSNNTQIKVSLLQILKDSAPQS